MAKAILQYVVLFESRLFFGFPISLLLALSGFVFLFSPHRRPNLGVTLFFSGLLLFGATVLLLI